MGLIDSLASSVLNAALSPRDRRSTERREFREQLLKDLRDYSALVEGVRIRMLEVDDLLSAGEGFGFDRGPESILQELEDDYMSLPPYGDDRPIQVHGATERRPDARGGPDAEAEAHWLANERASAASFYGAPIFPTVIERARERFVELDEAWANVRPGLDEAIEIEAVEWLRTYRHNFRHLAIRTFVLLDQLKEDSSSDIIEMTRRYVEATLEAADHWNAQIIGTIGNARDGRPM